MKIFLDENFPLQLFHELNDSGYDCEHVLKESMRSATDHDIAEHVRSNDYVLMTKDEDFLDLLGDKDVSLLLSRVPQELPIEERVSRWLIAVETFFDHYEREPHLQYKIDQEGDLFPLE